ncbi:helix-turn-helix domain-containing protein [Planosporangium sp. 12N6]|uniref:helix-turn-helix domain-containing protein n=1 Tax=Planosporangium spinosum TaxID=3402278 RepID=UPI003CEAC14C
MDATAQRVRVGAHLRRLRVLAGLSGDQVAGTLGWSQSKVSRIEAGRHAVAVRDIADLLEVYGSGDDLRAELLGATATGNGEGAWLVRTSGPRPRRGPATGPEPVTARLREYQPAVLPGLLQTREYARRALAVSGTDDPDALAEAWMRHQEILTAANGPRYDLVLDARALLSAVAPVDVIHDQILSLAVRAQRLPRLDLRIVPVGRPAGGLCAVGFTLYDFHHPQSRPVACVESPTAAAYFAAPDDIRRYTDLFASLWSAALPGTESIRYLRSIAADLDRYLGDPAS